MGCRLSGWNPFIANLPGTTAAKCFYPIDSEVLYFSPMITLISKKNMGGFHNYNYIPRKSQQPIFFFGSFPQKNVPTTSLARGLVGTLGIHDALLKVGLPDEELQIPWTSAMWTLEVKWWNARRKMAPKIAMNYHGKRRSNIHVLIYFVRIIYIHICIYFLALCIYKYKLCSIVYCLLCVDALFIISQYKIYLKGGKTWTESYEASGTLPFGERWVNLSAVPAATKTHNSNLTGSIVSKQPKHLMSMVATWSVGVVDASNCVAG